MELALLCDEDKGIRAYARRLHQDGEDAYHNSVVDVLTRGQMETIRVISVFFRVATRYALYKMFRHESAERLNIEAWLNGYPPPMTVGLANGRLPRTHCRKNGHPLVEGNLAYIGARRTCLTCKREREAADARRRRQDGIATNH